jgi:hypothetical protein
MSAQGIRIVRAGDLDTNTPQTPGMTRAAAIKSCAGRRQQTVGWNRCRPTERKDWSTSSRRS